MRGKRKRVQNMRRGSKLSNKLTEGKVGVKIDGESQGEGYE